jgi:hypothetical protein
MTGGSELDSKSIMIMAILVTHAVIFVIQVGVRRWTSLEQPGLYGIYLMLLPIGFNCFGVDLSPLFVAAIVLLGLFLLLTGVNRSLAKERAS